MAQSTISIARIDQIIMEGGSPTIGRDEFKMIVANELNTKMEQIWRVKLNDDGSIWLYSFAMPSTEKNLSNRHCLNYEMMPQWIRERISVLQICELGDKIDGVGQKVSETTYYVIE